MSDAFSGVGALFQRSNMHTSPTFTTIAELNDFDGPTMKRDTIDTTSLDTTGGYRTFIAGFRDGGEVTLNLNFTYASYDALKDDFDSDDARDYKIVLPDAGNTTLWFTALVTSLGMKVPNNDKVTASATLKISGEVTLIA